MNKYKNLGYLSDSDHIELSIEIDEIQKMIYVFANKLTMK